MIGAESTGVLSLINSVFILGITFATAGLNIGITRTISEHMAKNNSNFIGKTLKTSLIYSIICSFISSFLLITFSNFISTIWLKTPQVSLALKILAASLPFIAINNMVCGYLTARRHITAIGIIHIFEEAARIIVCLTLFILFKNRSLQIVFTYVAIGAFTSSGLCAIISLCILLKRSKFRSSGAPSQLSPLLKITIPVAISSCIKFSLSSFKQLLTPVALQKSGQTLAMAHTNYGNIMGIAMTVIMFPSTVLTSLAQLLVPEVTEFHATGKISKLKTSIIKILALTITFGIIVGAFLYHLAPIIGNTWYKSPESAGYIRALIFIIPIIYFDIIVDGLLKGVNAHVSVVVINIFDTALTISMIWLIVPIFGIKGYLSVLYASEILNASLSIFYLNRTIKKSKNNSN
jgi:stage V sporulation protein B